MQSLFEKSEVQNFFFFFPKNQHGKRMHIHKGIHALQLRCVCVKKFGTLSSSDARLFALQINTGRTWLFDNLYVIGITALNGTVRQTNGLYVPTQRFFFFFYKCHVICSPFLTAEFFTNKFSIGKLYNKVVNQYGKIARVCVCVSH